MLTNDHGNVVVYFIIEAEVKPSPTATLNENVKGLYQEKLEYEDICVFQ